MRRQFLWFALAGAAGFLVDIAVLYAALYAGAGYYLGRILSFTAAATCTWLINRRHAFAHAAGGRLLHEWLRYLFAMLGGGAVNYLVYATCIQTLPHETWLPLFAVAVGSIAGLLVNFMVAKNWVFRSRKG
jgi:putative flippase GtrA